MASITFGMCRGVSTPKPCRAAAGPVRIAQPVHRARDVRMAFFNFNKLRTDSSSAGIYGSQGREDYSVDDVEHYFNYMGMLAVEGTYDRMEQMLSSGRASEVTNGCYYTMKADQCALRILYEAWMSQLSQAF